VSTATRPEPEPIDALMSRMLERLRTRYCAVEPGVRTGFYDLDEMLGALSPGSITVVTGPSAAGRTTLALGIAANAAASGTPTLVASNKLAADDIAQRMLAITSKVSGVKLRDGRLSEQDWAAVAAGTASLGQLPLDIIDHVNTIEHLATIIEALPQPAFPSMVVIDRIDPLTKAADERAVVDALRRSATARSCAIVATAITRAGVPDPTHSATTLSELADATVALDQPVATTRQPTPIGVHVIRNRFGPTGTIQLISCASIPAFLNCAGDGLTLR
jgi:replicative DNA helicase